MVMWLEDRAGRKQGDWQRSGEAAFGAETVEACCVPDREGEEGVSSDARMMLRDKVSFLLMSKRKAPYLAHIAAGWRPRPGSGDGMAQGAAPCFRVHLGAAVAVEGVMTGQGAVRREGGAAVEAARDDLLDLELRALLAMRSSDAATGCGSGLS